MDIKRRDRIAAIVHYWDVGHWEGPAILWWWENNKLKTKQVESGNEHYHSDETIDWNKAPYSGRFDKTTKALSVLSCNRVPNFEDVPERMMRALERKFKPKHIYYFNQNETAKRVAKRRMKLDYMTIGHNIQDGFLWWWKNGKLYTHEFNGDTLTWHGNHVSKDTVLLQGRFDRKASELSIVVCKITPHIQEYKDLPDSLMRQLLNKSNPTHIYFFPFKGQGVRVL